MSPAGRPQALANLLLSRVLRGAGAGLINIGFPYLALTQVRTGAFLLGLLYALGAISTAALTLVLSRYGSRTHLRHAYLLSMVLLPVAAGLLLLPPELPVLALACALGGISATGSLAGGGVGGPAMPLQTAVLSDLVPASERTVWFGRFTFVATLASAGGTLLGGYVGLEDLFLLALALSTASIVAAIPVPVRKVERGRVPTPQSRETIRRFTATGVLNGFSQGLLTPFLIPFFVIVFGVPRPEMAVLATLAGVIGTFAVLTAPALERWGGFVRAVVTTRLVGAALAVAMPFVPFLAAVAFYLALPALRVAALPAQTAALMGRVSAEDRSEGAGINQAARVAAASGATALGGFALEDLAVAIPFIGYGAALAINSYLYIRFFGWRSDRIPTAST